MEEASIEQQHKSSPSKNTKTSFVSIHPNVDYNCLKIYDENNEHFSMAIILEKEDGQVDERVIGYDCFYRYGLHRMKFRFHIQHGLWNIIPRESNESEKRFDWIFNDVQFLTLDEQIQIILKRCDQYFQAIDRLENEIRCENKLPISVPIVEQMSTTKTIPEDENDTIDYGLCSFITGSRPKFTGLIPPPVAPRRSRQNSACSTQSSVRYASFFPPPTAPVRRRRVIESILLHVQRKKKPFEKFVDLMKGIERPTIHELGSEFLRIFDGRFNYREGHTFELSFRKKTWFLTIDQIKCVDCPVNEIGPRSVLILNYKGHYTSVHV